MSDLAPDLFTSTDARGVPDTEELLGHVEALVREICESPFPNIYDTFLGGAGLAAVAMLVRARRFRILWSEDEADCGERHIGFFPSDNVDERELAAMTRMLSCLTPHPPDEPEDEVDAYDNEVDDQDVPNVAEIARGLRNDFEHRTAPDLRQDDEAVPSDEEVSVSIEAFLVERAARRERLVGYANAALSGLLANGITSYQQDRRRHEQTASEAWAHAHAMIQYDPDFGEETESNEDD